MTADETDLTPVLPAGMTEVAVTGPDESMREVSVKVPRPSPPTLPEAPQ